ncbi:hypothetical protein JW926_16995 [Candidatus Sumerlaeota bacterium]|nr:hypothetical protein [Candidatus Sumerlaeota bacterium]
MDDLEKQIKESLSSEGFLDPEKSRSLKKKSIEYYDRALKKSEYTFVFLVVFCLLTIIIAWIRFTGSAYPKQQIFYGAVMTIGFLALVFIALLSFIINNRIGLLKEIKMIRLGVEEDASQSLKHPLVGTYARAEYAFWAVGIIVSLIILAQILFPGFRSTRYGLHVNKHVTIQYDGAASSVEHVSFPVIGKKPLFGFSIDFTGSPDCMDWKWFDGKGRKLIKIIRQKDGKTEVEIDLFEPVMPGEWMYYRLESQCQDAVKRTENERSFEMEDLYGYPDCACQGKMNLAISVELPKGAQIISLEPDGAERTSIDNIPVIYFRTSKTDKKVKYLRIKFKL